MQIITINNIIDLDYSTVLELLSPIYTKEIPVIDIGKPVDLIQIEKLATFFVNQYAFIAELWGVMLHQVRLLKRTSKNKDAIDEAMDKRDLLAQVLAVCKVKHYACSRLLSYHGERYAPK